MKTKLISTRSGSTFATLGFFEKSFFNTFLSFTPYWDYKPTNDIHADSPSVYTSDEKNLGLINKIHLKFDCLNGSIVSVIQQPILYGFILNKPLGYKVSCQTERVHCKINKSNLNSKTFYLETENHGEIDFN